MLLYMAGRGVRGEPARAPRLEGRPELAVFLAGICLGLAVFLDHTAVIPGAVIVAYALIRVPPRMLLFLALGGAPAAAAVLAYDKFAFQNAGVTGYSTNWSGVGGSPAGKTVHDSALWGMSFSPSRGLFFLSPFLLLAFPGLYLWRKRGGWEWLVCLLAPVALFGFVSTIYYWPGGTSLGPRYLIEILPLLALPIVFVLDRVRSGPLRLGIYALIVLSFVNVWIEMTGAAGYPAPEIANPIFDYSIPHLLRGDVPLTLGAVLLAPFTGIHSKWTLLPLPVMIALWTLYCARPTRRRAHEERPSRLQATPESPGAP